MYLQATLACVYKGSPMFAESGVELSILASMFTEASIVFWWVARLLLRYRKPRSRVFKTNVSKIRRNLLRHLHSGLVN